MAGAAAGLLTGGTVATAQQLDLPRARLLGTLPLDWPASNRVPLETLVGSGLDARLFSDLARISSEALFTSNESFFIRTAAPQHLPANDQWSISVTGRVRERVVLALNDLESHASGAGVHLLECSGNTAPTFGLISAADWEGVPIAAVLDRVQPLPDADRVLISGIDDVDSSTSVPGASWIFSRDELDRAAAFLATRMNRQPLPRHHGGPIRLVVPGWYGCVSIKWVNEIALVNDEAPATTQMREFAARTHQSGAPALARDFAPAVIDVAAMPVRVEKWTADGRLVYRIVGIVWGGSKPTNKLSIRFKAGQAFVPVTDCPLPASTTTWSLWSHLWRPETAGRYQIVLRVDDPAVRARRLDLYFYAREVSIDEV